MSGVQLALAQVPSALALTYVLSLTFFGAHVVKSKDAEIKAKEAQLQALRETKEEQLKAKTVIIEHLERLTPSRMLDHVEAQKRFFEEQIEFIEQRSRDNQGRLSELSDAHAQEAESLRTELDASRDQIERLKTRLGAAQQAVRGLNILREDYANHQRGDIERPTNILGVETDQRSCFKCGAKIDPYGIFCTECGRLQRGTPRPHS